MRKGTVVFELTDREIRALWFSVPPFSSVIKPENRSKLVKFDRIPIPTGIIEQGNVRNEGLLIDLLSRYGSQLPKSRPKAYLAISLQQGFIRAYPLPWLPKRDRTSALALLVDEEISIARSDLLYDFLIISEEKPKSLRILLGATRQSILERYVFIFEKAGFKVNGVDFSFSVLGQTLGFDPNEDVLYLHGEAGCFQVALFRGEVPESVRILPPLPSIDGCEWCESEQIEEREKEIQRFLLYYKTQQTDLNLKRLVWSGDSVTEKLAQRLLASNHVSTGDQATLKSVPNSWQEILKEHVGRSEVVVGYAQRILAHDPVLNLWGQPAWAEKIRRRYLGLAFFLGSLLVIGVILWFSLQRITMSLQLEVQLLSPQGAEIEGQAKYEQALGTAWNAALVRTEKVGEALAEVQTLSGNGLRIEQVVYKQGSMSLSGIAEDASSVQTLIHTLRTKGWEQPALTSYKLTTLNNVEFSMSARHGTIGMQPVKASEANQVN
ncbi:hypothetical protein JCM17380_48230 [Desulfosporosinus burensis]